MSVEPDRRRVATAARVVRIVDPINDSVRATWAREDVLDPFYVEKARRLIGRRLLAIVPCETGTVELIFEGASGNLVTVHLSEPLLIGYLHPDAVEAGYGGDEGIVGNEAA